MTDEVPHPDGPGQASATEFLTRAQSKPEGVDADAERFAIDLARLCADDKCTQVVVLDVRGLSPITNFLVIASGTSERQMRSVLSHAEELAQERGINPHGLSKDAGGHWLVADFVDVVTHLFEPNTRAHYDLEMLWGDAREIAWERA